MLLNMAVLHAIAGPIKGAVFHLTGEEVAVGRLSTNQLCIGDPSVSRRHCAIEPAAAEFRIRDLGGNNGTFVNGARVGEAILADGDRIRIGDTVLAFTAHGALSLPDNGVVANSYDRSAVPESAETAVRKLVSASADSGFGARARSLLRMGARLNAHSEPDGLQAEILKCVLEITPADRAAIVLLDRDGGDDATVAGWTRVSGGPATVPVSRTLVTRAIRESAAIFSDEVNAPGEFADVTSLTGRRVESVIVVPLAADGEVIGTIYLESGDPREKMSREHLELAAVIADSAGPALERMRRLRSLGEDNRRLRGALRIKEDLIGRSRVMGEISERIAKVARTDATVLIRGETGTGKELAARAIHVNSTRAVRPFEALNCSLLRDALLESELFGHERGSFTGAVAQRKGKIELAEGGTLFLDELGALGESPQAMLLRVLQTREYQRLGGSRTFRADIRIIAATNEDLEEAIRRKAFRQDLYYRLNVISLQMPPLRERREDIPLLAEHFIQVYSRKNKRSVTCLSAEAADLLRRYDWPGNVRELENAIEHAVVFGSTSEVVPEDLPDGLLEFLRERPGALGGYHGAVRQAKCDIVLSAVRSASGDYNKAAKDLGIHVNNLHRLIRELGLKPLLDARLPH